MENNYADLPQQEIYQDQQQNYHLQHHERVDSYSYCLMITSAFSTLLGGMLFYDFAQTREDPSGNCSQIFKLFKYYSHYLLISGVAQIFICFIVIFVCNLIKHQNMRTQVDKQLLIQLFDHCVMFIVLVIIESFLKHKKFCITYGIDIFLALYMLWIYLLIFMCAAKRFGL